MVSRTRLDALEAQQAVFDALDERRLKSSILARSAAATKLAGGRSIVSTDFDKGFITVKNTSGGEGASGDATIRLNFATQRPGGEGGDDSGTRLPILSKRGQGGNFAILGENFQRAALATKLRIERAAFNAASKERAKFDAQLQLQADRSLASRKAQSILEGSRRSSSRTFLQRAAAGLADEETALVRKV